MLDALKITPGATVADVGAGVGYTSLRLARRVGPEGTVLATDIQPRDAPDARRRTPATAGVTNIKPSSARPTDPKLPEGKVDLILMVDVYHECSDPEATLQGPAQGPQARRPARPGRVPRRGPRRPDQARAQDDRSTRSAARSSRRGSPSRSRSSSSPGSTSSSSRGPPTSPPPDYRAPDGLRGGGKAEDKPKAYPRGWETREAVGITPLTGYAGRNNFEPDCS